VNFFNYSAYMQRTRPKTYQNPFQKQFPGYGNDMRIPEHPGMRIPELGQTNTPWGPRSQFEGQLPGWGGSRGGFEGRLPGWGTGGFPPGLNPGGRGAHLGWRDLLKGGGWGQVSRPDPTKPAPVGTPIPGKTHPGLPKQFPGYGNDIRIPEHPGMRIPEAGLRNPGGGRPDMISANIAHWMNEQKKKQDLLKLIDQNARFISFQEVGSKKTKEMFKRVLARNGYGFFGKGGTPMAFKKGQSGKILERGSHLITPGGKFYGKGAGPQRQGAKFANYIVVRGKNGQERVIMNTHAPATQGNKTRLGIAHAQQRKITNFSRQLEKKYGKDLARYIMGDMNQTKAGKMQFGKGLKRYGAGSSTFDKQGRMIDWFLSDAGLKHRGTLGMHSDHDAILANFNRGNRGRNIKRQNPKPPKARF
jgi:hypothetical protein